MFLNLATYCQAFFLTAEQTSNTDTQCSHFKLCLKRTGTQRSRLLLKPFSSDRENRRLTEMNFFATLLLFLFISVQSSNATQDGTFHKNSKINGENLHLLIYTKDQAIGLYRITNESSGLNVTIRWWKFFFKKNNSVGSCTLFNLHISKKSKKSYIFKT